MNYSLQFELEAIPSLEVRYILGNGLQQQKEDFIESTIVPRTKSQGFYTKDDFIAVCHWKTPRTQPRCIENDESFIREVTSIALATHDERLRIEVLTLLNGVSWPTASVLLHFAHEDRYPILDFRALASLAIPVPNIYDFKFWNEYVSICRDISEKAKVGMRTLDRALWQHSKETVVA